MNHNGNFSGVVLDEDGSGLPSANIYLSNSSNGTVPSGSVMGATTDANGKFNFSNYSSTPFSYITASFIGYNKNSQKLTDIDEQNILFKMIPSSTQLNEVVIESGKSKKKNLAYIGGAIVVLGLIVTIIIKSRK
jgi:hypothetical protein